MGNKQYHEHELTEDWARARDASIHYGELRNHRKSTKKNDRRVSLWVACDFMDMGVMSAETIQDTDWLELVERYRAGQTRSGNPLTEGSIRKRKEALVQMLKAMKLNEHSGVCANVEGKERSEGDQILESRRNWKPCTSMHSI